MVIIAYHMYTEILLKNKLWISLNELKLKSKAMIINVSTAHRAIVSAEPLSYTTYSVVEAPKKNEPLTLKHTHFAEPNLRELLLESGSDGTTDFLY